MIRCIWYLSRGKGRVWGRFYSSGNIREKIRDPILCTFLGYPASWLTKIDSLRASNNIPLKQNRLRSSKVRNIPKDSLCRFTSSRGIEIVQALPSQSSLHLVRRIGWESKNIPAQKARGSPGADCISCGFYIVLGGIIQIPGNLRGDEGHVGLEVVVEVEGRTGRVDNEDLGHCDGVDVVLILVQLMIERGVVGK